MLRALGADVREVRVPADLAAAGSQFLDQVDRCIEGARSAGCDETDRLRSHAGGETRADGQGGPRSGEAPAAAEQRQAVGLDHALEDVHCRSADEGRHEPACRAAVDFARASDLLDTPAIHDDKAIGERHRLDLVMRDKDRSRVQPAMQLANLRAHLDAELCIEVGERFVEQKDLRFADHGAAHGDALPLSPRKRRRFPVEQRFEFQGAGDCANALHAFGGGNSRHLERIADVLRHAHMRIERIVLEHHRAAAFTRFELVDDSAVDRDLAAGNLLEPGDHPEQRGLAAAGRPENDDEFARHYVEVDAVHDLRFAVGFLDVANGDGGHQLFPCEITFLWRSGRARNSAASPRRRSTVAASQ